MGFLILHVCIRRRWITSRIAKLTWNDLESLINLVLYPPLAIILGTLSCSRFSRRIKSRSRWHNLPNAKIIKMHFVDIVPSEENKRPSPLYHMIAGSATIIGASSPTAGIGMFKYLSPGTPLTIHIFPVILLHLYVTVRKCVNDMLEVKPFSKQGSTVPTFCGLLVAYPPVCINSFSNLLLPVT